MCIFTLFNTRAMRNKVNVINTIPASPDYPMGRIKDDTGVNDGTPICEENNGDIQETVTALMERAKITPNGKPDNVTNGYQIFDAITEVGGKHDMIYKPTQDAVTRNITVSARLDNMINGEFIILDGEGINSNAPKINNMDLVSTDVGVLRKGDFIVIEKVNDLTFKATPLYGATRLKGAMVAIQKGTHVADQGAPNGILNVEHPEVNVQNTRVIYTLRRHNPQTSFVTTEFKSLMLDRQEFGFRIVFNGFPVDINDRLAVDWWIVEA